MTIAVASSSAFVAFFDFLGELFKSFPAFFLVKLLALLLNARCPAALTGSGFLRAMIVFYLTNGRSEMSLYRPPKSQRVWPMLDEKARLFRDGLFCARLG